MGNRKPNRSVVIGTIGDDAHIIGGWVLMHTFKQAGFTVAYLGGMTPQQAFINAAVEIDADAILVSSSYGMGLIDCEGLRDKCVEAGLNDILLYVGGSIAPSMELENHWDEVERRYREMGFNRVFGNTVTAKEAVAYLENDLEVE
ncbi:MAG: methylaspartate mutase subunit S [Clostridiales Family XIII bacterium]|jgi:methylaspartate mutase sigma subunit|nr:methylaspartate mutase subunit S [Clostridiales Family XIII bacterium]